MLISIETHITCDFQGGGGGGGGGGGSGPPFPTSGSAHGIKIMFVIAKAISRLRWYTLTYGQEVHHFVHP